MQRTIDPIDGFDLRSCPSPFVGLAGCGKLLCLCCVRRDVCSLL